MSTIVFVHAHPDDESSQTAGMMALAAERGHRVVVAYATGGEHGTRPPELDPETSLAEYRRGEAEASARVTGTARVAWLGFHDSGMTGWEQNSDPRALASAEVAAAAAVLARFLDEEDADVVVGYDWHGMYGHPDHLAVHRLVRRAVELAARRPRLLEETLSRQSRRVLREDEPLVRELAESFGVPWPIPEEIWLRLVTGDDGLEVGVEEDEIAWAVELPPEIIRRKREAMACHASQTSDIGQMLRLPEAVFAALFGVEYLVEPGLTGPMRRGWPFD